MANTWFDPDGLLRKYGNTKTVPVTGGEYKSFGALREIEVRIDLTTLSTTPTIINDQVFFPKNVTIEEIVVETQVAATSGGSATFDIGLVSATDRSTEIDFNGFVAALAKTAVDTTGEKNTLVPGSTSAGALIGTVSGTTVGYISANYTTAAFTAGVIFVRIRYRTTS